MTRLILARHGESTVNVSALASDDHENNPLTELGQQQARGLAADLARQGVRAVYTSPTQRARETGQAVADAYGLPVAIEWGLEEIRVGVHQGEMGDVSRERGAKDFRLWLAEENLAHGYEDGETGHDVARRVSAALRRIVRRHPHDTVLVASHGGALALTLPTLCANLRHSWLFERQLVNCGWVDVRVAGEVWTCTSWMGEPVEQQEADRAS